MATPSIAPPTCNYSRDVLFFYDHVGKQVSAEWTPHDLAVIGLGLTVCALVVLANLLVTLAILANRRFHFPIYYLLANMAAADLFAGAAYANMMLHTGPWTRTLSKRQWYVRSALVDVSLTASVASLLAVAVERHQTVVAMQLHSSMSRRRVLLLIGCIWAAAAAAGLLPSAVWNCECDLADCSTVAPLYSRRFLVVWALLNLLSFSVMLAVYARIFLYVRRQSRRAARHTSEARHGQTVVNLMKTIAMVLGAFVICWTPGLLTLLLDGLMGRASRANSYEKYCLVLAECNSLVNPIIYCLRDAEMRETFQWLLCCLCRRARRHRQPAAPGASTLPEESVGCVQRTDGPAGTGSKKDSWTVLPFDAN